MDFKGGGYGGGSLCYVWIPIPVPRALGRGTIFWQNIWGGYDLTIKIFARFALKLADYQRDQKKLIIKE